MSKDRIKKKDRRRSEDAARKEEKSFLRFAAVAVAIFLVFICFIKRDNVFRWVQAGFTVHRQEKQIEQYKSDIERLEKEYDALTTERDSLEKFAREKFFLAEPGEDVYIYE